MELQQLQCLQCGGQLDPTSRAGSVIKCQYCGAGALLREGRLYNLASYSLPEEFAEDTLIGELVEKLKNSGFEAIPSIEKSKKSVLYLCRRGRARVKPMARSGSSQQIAKQYEEVREGLFGLPVGGKTDMIFLEDTSALQKVSGDIPDDLADELLRFDDLIQDALERDVDERIFEQTKPVKYAWASYDVRTSWHDDVYLVSLSVIELSFVETNTGSTLFTAWRNANPEGRYSASYNCHDGLLLTSNLPYKGKNTLTCLLLFFVMIFLLPAVGFALFSLLGTLLGVVLAA
ncbi:MAG: hypothetical protein HN348_17380 [Proteobacteria bacterium]|jgi:hypothetical protein|nr:hypothetical protein [Pseudomonadota bacterium]